MSTSYSSPGWLPPLNSHDKFVLATRIEEWEGILAGGKINSNPKEGEYSFLLKVNFTVKYFRENDKSIESFIENENNDSSIGFPGLFLSELFKFLWIGEDGELADNHCEEFLDKTDYILNYCQIPFQLSPIRFLKTNNTDNSYINIEDQNDLMSKILSALSEIRRKYNKTQIIPVRWHIFKHVIISDDEYYTWTSWYNEKSRVNPNFECQYMEAISRPRSVDELLYEEDVKLKPSSSTSSSIWGSEVANSFGHNNNCSVCLEDFSDESNTVCLPCSHVFHRDCIAKWIQESHKCPLCRFSLTN